MAGCTHQPFTSIQGETTHYHRAHSGRIRAPHQKRFKPVALNGNGNGNGRPIARALPEVPPRKIDRRTKAWRRANPKLARKLGRYTSRRTHRQLEVANVEVNFCPKCGTDLHKVAIGMLLAAQGKI